MAKEQSASPKERVNITYKTVVGGAQEQKELPLKMLALGDYTGEEDSTPLEERKPININKDNFTEVLKAHKLAVDVTVPDRLAETQGAEMSVELRMRSLKDFEPEGIVEQVPELKKLLELRQALVALKGPLSSKREFRDKLTSLLADNAATEALLQQLGVTKD